MYAATEPDDLDVVGISKTFDLTLGAENVLDDVSLHVRGGSFACIVGASGCGKSTLLRIVAGLEADYSGHVALGGRRVEGTSIERGMVFQEHRLLPWLTVAENVALGLGRLDGASRARRVNEYLDLVRLLPFKDAYPYQLSGGMAQRVSIGRALVNKPRLLLLDEPFGALDALTRIRMHDEILRIWKAEQTTMVLVTHDLDEAIYLADEIVVMSHRPGRIKSVIPIGLTRPRDRNDPDFVRIRAGLFAEFFHKNEDYNP